MKRRRRGALPYCHSCHTAVEDWDLHNQLLHPDAEPEPEPIEHGPQRSHP